TISPSLHAAPPIVHLLPGGDDDPEPDPDGDGSGGKRDKLEKVFVQKRKNDIMIDIDAGEVQPMAEIGPTPVGSAPMKASTEIQLALFFLFPDISSPASINNLIDNDTSPGSGPG